MTGNKCPKCGTTMVENFDYKPGPTPSVTLAIPNGKFDCLKCQRATRCTGNGQVK